MKNLTKLLIAMVAVLPIAGAYAAGNPGAGPSSAKVLSGSLSPQQRGDAVATFVRRWGPYVQSIYGVDVHTWARRMVPQFASGDAVNIQRALARTTFEGAIAELDGRGRRLTDAQAITMLASTSFAPGSIPAPDALGSVDNDLVYTAITPCRIVDSRVAGGPIPANTSRDYVVWGIGSYASQGGSSTNCGLLNENPSAAVLNVTVVGPAAAGYLTAYAFNTPRPLTASVNYLTGAIVNNTIITPLAPGAPNNDLTLYSLRQTNVVVDIVGYFDAPHATALDCVENADEARSLPANTNTFFYNSTACPAGYSQVSQKCGVSGGGVYLTGQGLNMGNGGFCSWSNTTGSAVTVYQRVTCCRVPGR